jgi:hypothetical protein
MWFNSELDGNIKGVTSQILPICWDLTGIDITPDYPGM